MPINFVDSVRTALTSGDPTSLDGNGLYLYGAMQGMTLEEQMDILSGSYRTVNFMFAETQEEEMLRRMNEQFATQQYEQAGAIIDDLSSGQPVNAESIQAVINGFAATSASLTPERRAVVAERINALGQIAGYANTLNAIADPAYVRNEATNFATRGLEGQGLDGVDTEVERAVRDFMTNYATRMEETLATDPLSWARDTGAVAVGTVDVSASALSAGESGLAQRVLDARAVAARYNIPVNHIFGAADAPQIVSQIDPANFELSLGQVQSIIQGLGEYAEIGIQELEAAGLAPELVMAMDVPNFAVQRQLVQIAGVETTALRENLAERTMATDIETEINTQLADYFVAFQAGRDPNDAIGIANSMRATAQRLAFFRAGSSSESASQIAKSVIADLFPPETNWVRQPNQLFIVPREFNSTTVQVAADRMMSDEMLRQFDLQPLDNPLFPEYVDLELNIASLSSTGVWLNNSTGDGLILHYDLGVTYEQARDRNGQPYELLFSDAAAQAQAQEDQRAQDILEGMQRAP
jgi:hypothetical protein